MKKKKDLHGGDTASAKSFTEKFISMNDWMNGMAKKYITDKEVYEYAKFLEVKP